MIQRQTASEQRIASLSFRVSGRKELLWFFALYADRQAEQ